MKFWGTVRLLKNKKLSQIELGKLFGMSQRTISNFESDGRYPK